jgi:hypothetical protein
MTVPSVPAINIAVQYFASVVGSLKGRVLAVSVDFEGEFNRSARASITDKEATNHILFNAKSDAARSARFVAAVLMTMIASQ